MRHFSVYLDPPAAEALDRLTEANGGKKAAVQAAIMATDAARKARGASRLMSEDEIDETGPLPLKPIA